MMVKSPTARAAVVLLSGQCFLLLTTDAFVVPASPITVRSRSLTEPSPLVIPPSSRPTCAHTGASLRPYSSALVTMASGGPLSWIRSNRPVDGKNRLAMGLAFLTGWADVALVFKYKDFATMHTGSTFKLAWATVDSRFGDVGYYASVMICYMLGLASFRRAELSLKDKSLTKFCFPVVTALFCWADYLSFLNPARKWPSMTMLSFAFGIINSVGTEMAGTLAFVLTGHMTKLTNLIVDRFSRSAGRKPIVGDSASAALRSTSVIFTFLGGAIWACEMLKRWPKLQDRGGFAILGSLFGLLFLWQDRDTLGAWWRRGDNHLCEIVEYDGTCK